VGTRTVLLVVLLLVAAGVLAGTASSLAIDDSTCPNVAGENTNTCPAGTVGAPYSIRFKEREGSGCGPGRQTFHLDSGALPPGLGIELNGALHGTPTQAGTYRFYLEMREPEDDPGNCRGDRTQKQFTLDIDPSTAPPAPALPELTIGPEQSGVPVATVGSPYRLAMTANLADAKTWSIADGALPLGTALDPTSGLISGTPAAAGSFSFTVRAAVSEQQADTKALTIIVREPLVVSFPDLETSVGTRIRWEVGVPFSAQVLASGGAGAYTWRIAGMLPAGITLGQDGVLTGRPLTTGVFRFGVIATDGEGRAALSAGRLTVAQRLSIVPRPLRRGRVGKAYRRKLYASGGVVPKEWELVRGVLPRGVALDGVRGMLVGEPREAGRYRVRIRAVDALGVRSGRTYLLRIAPSRKQQR
jgi:hypothetical protein